MLDVQPSLARLSLSAKADRPEGSTRRHETALAESWEEELSSGEDDEPETERGGTAGAAELPKAPPPTPISPRTSYPPHQGEWTSSPDDRSPRLSPRVEPGRPRPSQTRPEKTDAVARRMIAGALGVRPPTKTDEQREYEKVMMEKERKKRSRERESREAAIMETERAKAAIWEDSP